ncbi:glycosyltransferase [Citrobacter braakii]|uniref:Glycosyl transferase n=1 Tax=Citrobacter braakii TaxID=57706 RepID=A0A2Z4BVD5_CITBR|nr:MULTISPECIES: glycosyltransferase family 4 protein [Citrobacter]MDU5155037.1 glycosyltransferase family 4 protein [Citrobacter sp.]TKV31812.1 glycosyltransferase [Citrobacter sp. TBCS-11]AWU66616.1 glycosyl transferase [Citrobacter braakii]EGT0651397.1 glycosyltransferase [Citrobacter braakii]TKU22443.1 glycosyltransferase [Citrobacter sp. wls826]
MLKVLHFYKTYYPDTFGGIEQVIYQLSESAVKYNVESTVLSLSKRGDIDNQLIGVQRVFYAKTNFEVASTPFSLSCIKKFKELAKQADIIHYHYPFPFMDMIHFLCRINKPTVVSYHSDIVKQKFISRLYSPLMNRFLNSVDSIVAASPNYAKTSNVLQKFESKVKIIPYGLNEKSYPNVSDDKLNYWREKVGDKFFLFIGAFRYYKGLHTLLEAVHSTTLPVVIVGGGGIEQELRLKAKELNLSNVHFVGALNDEDKTALLQLCYSVVFPSHLRSEAFGITLLEGAMFGKPLISCEIGTGTSYINIDKYTGIVVPPANTLKLREAMNELWDSPKLARLYGNNAYERFNKTFTSVEMSKQYFLLYKGLLSQNIL